MGDIVHHLRIRAQRQTATGITEPHEHIDWIAADEIERLRAALKPFADRMDDLEKSPLTKYTCATTIEIEHLCAARDALKNGVK